MENQQPKRDHSLISAAWKGDNGFWLYAASLLIVFVAITIAQLPLIPLFKENLEALQTLDFAAAGIADYLGFALVLISSAAGLFALLFCVRYVHQRPELTVINPLNKIDWQRFFFGAGLWIALAIVFEVIAYFLHPEVYTWTFEAKRFFPVLLVALALIPFQASFEELVFRGYLMQGFGTWFKNAWGAILVTGILFGGMHIANPEVKMFGTWILSYYMITGIFFGIISAMDESIELAMGMHTSNNIFGAVVVTFHGAVFKTPTLFTISKLNVGLMMIFFVLMTIIVYVVCSRKYNWGSIRKLNQKIVRPSNQTELPLSEGE